MVALLALIVAAGLPPGLWMMRNQAVDQDVIPAAWHWTLEEFAAGPRAMARVESRSLALLLIGDSMETATAVLGQLDQSRGLFTRFVRGGLVWPGDPWSRMVPDVLWTGLNAVIALAALAGLVAAFRLRAWRLLMVGGLTSLLLVVAAGTAGTERLRLTMMVPLLILAVSVFGRSGTLVANPVGESRGQRSN
jgi:hypothetical protein